MVTMVATNGNLYIVWICRILRTMLFGKHKNKYTWINIYQNDKKYCDWVLKQTPTYLQFLLFKQFVERMRFIR